MNILSSGRVAMRHHLRKAKLRECDVDTGELQELWGLALLGCRLLVSGDLRSVVLNLSGSGDERNQQAQPLPERGDIVVDLEEQVVLDLLRKSDAIEDG